MVGVNANFVILQAADGLGFDEVVLGQPFYRSKRKYKRVRGN